MAGLGFKDFQVGEVLTSSDVDGYLMQQTVMRFADSGARGSALGTASGTSVALAEGMLSYLDDVDQVQVYNGTAWVGVGGFSASTAITATDASWPVPSLADPVVRVTVVGGGGGGGRFTTNAGANGNPSSFACAAGTATAAGGIGGNPAAVSSIGADGTLYGGGGIGGRGVGADVTSGGDGTEGERRVAYLDMSGISTANVTVGAGGTGGGSGSGGGGGDGANGVVIVEYRAA